MAKHLNLTSKRADAVAPRSLFGTTVEIKDDKALRETANMITSPKTITPDKLAEYISNDDTQHIKEESKRLVSQKERAKHAKGKLHEAGLNALNFSPTSNTNQPGHHKLTLPKRELSSYKNDVKIHSSYIDLSEQYNRLSNQASYSHNKESPSSIKYQVLGNALGKGGHFTYTDKEFATVGPGTKNSKTRLPKTSKNSIKSSPRAPSVPIPANIRHTYGESVCLDVIEDAQFLIREDMSPSVDCRTARQSMSTSPSTTCKESNKEQQQAGAVDSLYDDLGNALRQDIFNGVSYSHMKSLNSSSYAGNIDSEAAKMYPPKFAKQRNEDSKWNEDMVIYQRLMKRWDTVMAERSQQPE